MLQTESPKRINDEKLNSFLRFVIRDKDRHALWLNTLSLLEHIGSRKILLTQSNDDTSEMILRHATEEARHALFFKKAARNIKADFKSGYHTNELLKGNSAKIYFAKLDSLVRSNLKKSELDPFKFTYLAYLYTTTVIEKRAMIVYENYNQLLESQNIEINLQNLILEEEGHLDEMSAEITKLDPHWEARLEILMEKENKIFERFLNQLNLIVA
ncbi:rubrerythrin [Leptospira ognonensis]|uniref:Rubrerythrin n=1 Tax=Leptospira ognonensis TaxID=2484945 RepID=A0A4R9K9K4_9LEPT|nr:rubrerythrin [Leptospira ognonensis]TGL62206.1 rubrerythrin [Leptospira ognonensis]